MSADPEVQGGASEELPPLWRCPGCGSWQSHAGRCRNAAVHAADERVIVTPFEVVPREVAERLAEALEFVAHESRPSHDSARAVLAEFRAVFPKAEEA